MADHVRKQIRNRVSDALHALPRFGGRVYQSRVYPITEDDLPGILVYTLSEESEREESPTDIMRDLTIAVQAVVALAADLDNALDDIALEVEEAIDALGRMEGLVKIYSGIQGTEQSYAGADAAKPHAAIAMEFLYTYRTRTGAPGVAI